MKALYVNANKHTNVDGPRYYTTTHLHCLPPTGFCPLPFSSTSLPRLHASMRAYTHTCTHTPSTPRPHTHTHLHTDIHILTHPHTHTHRHTHPPPPTHCQTHTPPHASGTKHIVHPVRLA